MTDIPLSPVQLWEMEFALGVGALPYDSRYPASPSGTGVLQHGTGYAEATINVYRPDNPLFIQILARLSNGYPFSGSFPPYTVQVGANIAQPVALASGKIKCSWMGQDVYRDTDGSHHRIGYGNITVNGASFAMPASWEMPLPIVEVRERGCQGTISITKMGPAGAPMLDMRATGYALITGAAFTADFGFGPVSLPALTATASADGKTFTFAGLPGPYNNRFGNIFFGPLTYTPQGYQPGSTFTQYMSSDPAFAPIVSVSYALTHLSIKAQASRYPDGDPFVGMPVTLGYLCGNGPGGARTSITYPGPLGALSADPVFTNNTGEADFSLFYDYSGKVGNSGFLSTFSGYTSIGLFAAEKSVASATNGESGTGSSKVRALGWLYDHGYDSRTNQPLIDFNELIGAGWQSKDVRGQIVLKTTPQISLTRKTQYAMDTGADTWAGIAIPSPSSIPAGYTAADMTAKALPSTFDASNGASIAVTNTALGTQFQASAIASGFTYGIQRVIAASKRRAFRNYRWMQIKLSASASASARLVLQTKAGYAVSWPLALKAGDNTFDLDMLRGDRYPFKRDGVTTRGVVPDWNRNHETTQAQFDEAGEILLRSYTSAPDTQWAENEVWYVRIDSIAAGVLYTLKAITLRDRTDGNRNTIRVLAGLMGNGGSTTVFENPAMQQAVGVSINGRRILSAPVTASSAPTAGGTFAQLAARWQDTFDAGAGVWTLAPLYSDGGVTPVSMVGPAANVSEAGFTLNSRLMTPYFSFLPGFDKTVADTLSVVFELGQQVDGTAINSATRAAMSGKTLTAAYKRPATSATATTWKTVTTDDDGYFTFPGFPHPWYYNPATGANSIIPVTITEKDDPAKAVWTMQGSTDYSNGNEFTYIVLATAPSVGKEQDLAQDISHGRIYRIFSDADTNELTVHVHDGHKGLSGPPVRTNVIHSKADGSPITSDSPSIWVSSYDGKAIAAYRRIADSQCVIAWSTDALLTLGAEMALFAQAGALPNLVVDNSTGITYVFGAFVGDTASVSVLRLSSTQKLMKWRDGSTEKVVAAGLTPAGRPTAIQNRYDKAQSLLLHYGDARYQSIDGGENWTVIT